MSHLTRRGVMSGMVVAVAGCKFYRDPPPVIVGGSAVSPNATAMTALRASSEHSRLVSALEASGVSEILDGIGPITLFAPTDAAFDAIRSEAAAKNLADDAGVMKHTLLNHMVPARLTSEDLLTTLPQMHGSTKVFALNNEVVRISGKGGDLTILDMRRRSVAVVTRDAIASNGIIHVIDGVLLPREDSLASP